MGFELPVSLDFLFWKVSTDRERIGKRKKTGLQRAPSAMSFADMLGEGKESTLNVTVPERMERIKLW
jgi:hypothetical protein